MRRYRLDVGAAASELRLHDIKIQGRKTAVDLSSLGQTSFDSHFTRGISEKTYTANKLLVIIHLKVFQRFAQTVFAWMNSEIHIYTFLPPHSPPF